ncbi:MAG: hypothetical protein HYY37_01545 [Candidatus Aenigmarchaeota archaeon]|nr:hypothetical protein [Candidatus Aenigmarchaeota archaeon]
MTISTFKKAALAGALGTGAVAGTKLVIDHYRRTTSRQPSIYVPPYRIEPLYGVAGNRRVMERLREELENEWGPFGPADMKEMYGMAGNAGDKVHVISLDGEPAGILQTGLADVHGDYERLVDLYPSFNHITGNGTWRTARRMRGDTALLLQVTAFGERGRGVGSLLRNSVLWNMPDTVRYALTTTPVDDNFDPSHLSTPVGELYQQLVVQGEQPFSYPPAVRFHLNGGAEPAGYAHGYKEPGAGRPNAGKGRQHNCSIVFMRYTRNGADWRNVERPDTMSIGSQPLSRR